MNFRSFYEKLNYKALMIFPIGLLIFSGIFLFYNYQATGEFFQRDIDLKGGIQLSVTLKNPINSADLENFLKTKTSEVSVRSITSATTYGILIEAPEGSEEELLSYLEEYGLDIQESSFQKTGPELGESFWNQSRLALIIAFIFMGIVVFWLFKKVVPSFAVILAATSDIVCTLAFMQILNMNLSLAGFAALLLTIGYSIDTDIVLTTRVLRRGRGEVIDGCVSALKTGLTMTCTTLAALVVLYFASAALVLQQIASVLIIALLIDLPNTWIQNMGIIRWWLE